MADGAKDDEAWAAAHVQEYGEDAWQRARRMAGELFRAAREDRSGTEMTDQKQQRLDAGASMVLALAIWRAGRAAGTAVDDVPLARALWWLGGAEYEGLFQQPLPPIQRSWSLLRHRSDVLVEYAHWAVTWHLQRDLAEAEELADTGEPPPEVSVGDRCRAASAGPADAPRWREGIEYTEHQLKAASAEASTAVWAHSPVVRSAAAALLPTVRARPTGWNPATAEDGDEQPVWAVRLIHLRHVHTTLGSVLEHHGDHPELGPHPREMFGSTLAGVHVALRGILPAATELEDLWERRDPQQTVASWERAHMPVPLRAHIRALESVVLRLRDLCWYLVHEEHNDQ